MRGTKKNKSKSLIKKWLKSKKDEYVPNFHILEDVDENGEMIAEIFIHPKEANKQEMFEEGYRIFYIKRKTIKGLISAAKKKVEWYRPRIIDWRNEAKETVDEQDVSSCLSEIYINRIDNGHQFYTHPTAFIRKMLKDYGYDNVIAVIKSLPKNVKTVTHAFFYIKKVLKNNENDGKIIKKSATKRNISFEELL